MAPIDARTLEIFRAVAETGSATGAAAKLHTTQPSVTRTIGGFERLCGFALFERGRYGMTLTPAGRHLLESVERNFAGLRTVQQTIAELRSGLPGTLRLAAIPAVAETGLGATLSAFMRAHPKIGVHLNSPDPEGVINQTLAGQVDLGAITGEPPPGYDLGMVPMGERRMVLVVASHHPLAGRETVHFRELHGEPMVQLISAHSIRRAMDALLNEFGVRPSVTHEVSTQRALIELVRLSDAVGFAELDVIDRMPAGSLATIEIEPPVSWPVNLIYRRDRAHSAAFDAFLEWLARKPAQRGA